MQDLINRLKHYNQWRSGAEIEMPAPAQLGKDIDRVIQILEEQMTENCAHYWEPSDKDKDGQPVFAKNRQFGLNPTTHAKCRYCGIRTWFTKKQWQAIPAGMPMEESKCTKD